MSNTLALAQSLIAKPSISPEDAGCEALISTELEHMGFEITHLPFGNTKNLFAIHGKSGPLLLFAGHTDVVPPGPESDWDSPPFEPTLRDGKLFGRGAADMKSSLAAMIIAVKKFLPKQINTKIRIGFLITSDEEADATDGTVKVVEWMLEKNLLPTWCIIGEPSSQITVGDQIRIGRRGSITGKLTINGIQGHVAYPDKAINPIHQALSVLEKLKNYQWDHGNEHFPPTSFQIAGIESSTQVSNIIPEQLQVLFNLRFSSELTSHEIQTITHQYLDEEDFNYHIDWHVSGEPFLSKHETLIPACQLAIKEISGIKPILSTGGGTSDGRFIAKLGCELIELGPVNASIHQVNEWIDVEELETLTQLYTALLEKFAQCNKQ